MSKDHWSTSEVAKELGVSPSLVRTWISYMNWEVRRNAEGHRVFIQEDIEQLRTLKAWLDEGNSLKEFRRERNADGPYDPRIELRGAYRRLKEVQSQHDALMDKQQALVAAFAAQQQTLQAQLELIRLTVEAEPSLAAAPAMPEAPTPIDAPAVADAPEVDPSRLVQGVLKQLLSSLLEKKGKLQLVRRFEEDGHAKLEYLAPTGKRQVIEDVLTNDEDRKLMETVLTLILNS
ncbi:MAG: MerR family transcriptional regulator [Candidatus Sericytochromatia bacterium]